MNRYKYIDEQKEHLHTLDGRPLFGTSSVLKVVAKPLVWWASGLAVAELGWTKIQDKPQNLSAEMQQKIAELGLTPKRGSTTGTVLIPSEIREPIALNKWNEIVKMSGKEYLALLDKAYKAHSLSLDKSADSGTDLHAELERFVKFCMETSIPNPDSEDANMFDNKIKPFIQWTYGNVKRFLWSEMHCYSEVNWLGGISDCGYEKYDGTVGIMDFKSSKDAYKSQFYQIAGYDIEITENGGFDKDGNSTFTLEKPITEYAVFPFGMSKPEPQFYYDMKTAKECFLSALTLYKDLEV